MKKRSLLAVLLTLLVLLAGCTQNVVREASEDLLDLDQLEVKATQIKRTNTVEDIQNNLKSLAPVFAKALQEDKAFRNLLGAEVGKQFDGDYDVLYDMISAKTSHDGLSVQSKLKRYNADLHQLVNGIPYFNIAIPVNFDQWGTYDGPIYVVPLRYDIDDQKIAFVTGYDAEGNTKTFSTATAPDFPVVVLGVNERIGMLKQRQEVAAMSATSISTLADTPVTTHDEYLRGLQVNGSWDLWPRGNPELYILYTVGDHMIENKVYYDAVDTDGAWYFFDRLLFTYEGIPENQQWHIRALDEDGDVNTTIDVEEGFTYGGTPYFIRGSYWAYTGDDLIGEGRVTFGHANTLYQTYTEYLFGDLGIRLYYRDVTPTN